jgi:hypothetical protein
MTEPSIDLAKHESTSTPKAAADVQPQNDAAVLRRRRQVGYWLMLGGAGLSVAALIWAACSLPSLSNPPRVTQDQAMPYMVSLGAHAITTLGGLYFAYQVVRAGERMALPAWMSDKAPLLLGIRLPVEVLGEVVRRALGVGSDETKE